MMRPSPGWITATSSSDISRWPDQTVASFTLFSSPIASAPPARRHSRSILTTQDAVADQASHDEDQRRRLRQGHAAAGQQVARCGIAQAFERATQRAEADTRPARDETRHLRSRTEEEQEAQVTGRGVELEWMTRRETERRKDDTPGKRGGRPVAAAGQEAPDPADPEGEEGAGRDGIEHLARGAVRDPGDHARRRQARADGARRGEPARPQSAGATVQHAEEPVPAGQGRHGDDRGGGEPEGRRRRTARDEET